MTTLRPRFAVLCAFALSTLGCSTSAPLPPAEGVVAQLVAGQYAQLDQNLSTAQADYESGAISEVQLREAFSAFREAEQDLTPNLKKWGNRMPKSYVAHLSQGIHLRTRAMRARGDALASEITPEQFAQMGSYFEQAAQELGKSLELAKKPLLTYLYALDVSNYQGDAESSRNILDAALKVAPESFLIRQRYMGTLETRWGGSQDAMSAFVQETEAANLPPEAMNRLRARVLVDQAWVAQHQEEFKRAGDLYMQAYRLGGDSGCASCAGESYFDAKEYPLAIEAYTAALKVPSPSAEIYYMRGYAYLYSRHDTEALPTWSAPHRWDMPEPSTHSVRCT
jgi:tetratricopeptide (TPR) repeat protein